MAILSKMNFIADYVSFVGVWLQWQMQEKMTMGVNFSSQWVQHRNYKTNIQYLEKLLEVNSSKNLDFQVEQY